MVAVILAVRSGGHSGNGNGQHDRGLIGRTSHGQADITGLGSGGNRDLELGGIAIRDLRFADHLLADGGGQLRLVRHTQRGKRKLREVQRERIASLDRAGRDAGDVHCAAVVARGNRIVGLEVVDPGVAVHQTGVLGVRALGEGAEVIAALQ